MKESAHSSTFLRLKQTFKKYLRSKVIILQRLYQMGGVKDVNICYFLRFFTKLSALHTNKLAKKACPRFGEHAFSAWGIGLFFGHVKSACFGWLRFGWLQKNGGAPEKVRLRLVLRFQEEKVILDLLSPY